MTVPSDSKIVRLLHTVFIFGEARLRKLRRAERSSQAPPPPHPMLINAGSASMGSRQRAGLIPSWQPTVSVQSPGFGFVNPELFCLVFHLSIHPDFSLFSPPTFIFFSLPYTSFYSQCMNKTASQVPLSAPLGRDLQSEGRIYIVSWASFFSELLTETKMGQSSSQSWVMNVGLTISPEYSCSPECPCLCGRETFWTLNRNSTLQLQ